MEIMIICIALPVIILVAAYFLYFKKLFKEVKKFSEIKQYYTEEASKNVVSEISQNAKKEYKDNLESASYRCSMEYHINNGRYYPSIVADDGISNRVAIKKNPISIKHLADLKIAHSFVRKTGKDPNTRYYYCIYDEGNLIVSSNWKVYETYDFSDQDLLRNELVLSEQNNAQGENS